MVEYLPSKQTAAGSSPVSRSTYHMVLLSQRFGRIASTVFALSDAAI